MTALTYLVTTILIFACAILLAYSIVIMVDDVTDRVYRAWRRYRRSRKQFPGVPF